MYMSYELYDMCGYICADVNMSQGGPAKASAKSTELYAIKAWPSIIKLFNFWHFMNKVALFNSLPFLYIYKRSLNLFVLFKGIHS